MPRKTKRKQKQPYEAGDLPTPEQLAQGGYERGFLTHAESNTKAMAYVNTGGTPLARWQAAGRIEPIEAQVIARCLEAWRLAGLNPSLTSQYGERLPSTGGDNGASSKAIEAERDLKSFKSHFPGRLRRYWEIFENVIRYDMPAGIVGASESEADKKRNAVKALEAVKFTCAMIAEKERQFNA